MDVRTNSPWWAVKNPIKAGFETLKNDIDCDVVVIGGGISGTLIAYHLGQAGLKTVVVDASYLGYGSSAASTALLQFDLDVPLRELQELLGKESANQAYLASLNSLQNLIALAESLPGNFNFSQKSGLQLASKLPHVSDLDIEAELRQELGINSVMISEEEMQKRFKIKSFGALLTKPAAQADAYAFTHALIAEASSKFGVQFFERSPVLNVDETDEGVSVICETGGTIRAKKVVYATGYEMAKWLKGSYVTLNSTFAFVSQPLDLMPRLLQDHVVWETANPYFYLRQTDDNRVIVGGEDEPFSNPVARDALLPSKIKSLQKRVQKLFPGTPIHPDFSWAGTFAETEDGMPFIGQVEERPNAYFAMGYGGNGITFSMLAREIITALITEGSHPNEALFGFERANQQVKERV